MPAETPCPVSGCTRRLDVDPAQTHQLLLCPCDRRARLGIGLSGTGQWVAREMRYSQDERQEHNLIARAIVQGQGIGQRGGFAKAPTAPDANSATMADAYLAMVGAARATVMRVLLGQMDAALVEAERSNAADSAYRLAAQRYGASVKKTMHSGRWHDTSEYWVTVNEVNFRFSLEGMWSEAGDVVVIANATELENLSGVPVGPGGWEHLVHLLNRVVLDSGSGPSPDIEHLIWRPRRDDKEKFELRPTVKQHYSGAVVALEALRRTLRPEFQAPEERTRREEAEAYAQQAEWQNDQLSQTEAFRLVNDLSVVVVTSAAELLTSSMTPRTGLARSRKKPRT